MPKKTLPFDPLTATDEQIRMWQMRENLARYGTTYAPEEVRRPANVTGPRGTRTVDPRWEKVKKTCPHCGKTKNVATGFGVVVRRGIEGPAGWCKQCRSTTNYRARPRKRKA